MGRYKAHAGRHSSAFRLTASLLLSFLALTNTSSATSSQPGADAVAAPLPLAPITEAEIYHDFTLRHLFHHGTYQDPHLHKRFDVPSDGTLWLANDEDSQVHRVSSTHLRARSQPITIHRLADRRLATIESHLSHARSRGEAISLAASQWTLDEVFGPDVTDRETIISLARAAADAYVETRKDAEWEDVRNGLNYSQSFGWQGDGLRGHVFADTNNATILVALKGTSPAVFDGEGTTTKDKVNDNLFFSCCCAQGGQYFWRQVCDCSSATYSCNQTCLVKALRNDNVYYRAAIELYTNVTELYPDSNVWLTGHSLGGSVGSLLGTTFGIPTVTFEAPGEALAASRLGLPAPPESDPKRPATRKYTGTYHFGHTADPIFMGTCNGATAACTLGGYAMETQCHTGQQCIYDTVTDLGWREGVGYHKIHNVIDNVLLKYDKLPQCVSDAECVDCFNWKYFESNGSDTTTSSSSTETTTRTRTSACKTPGWWGCLDETTTTTTSSSSTSPATSTSTCKTPGWFGCNDPTTTSSITSSAIPSPVPTITATPTASSTSVSTAFSTTSCHHHGWFGDCLDPSPSISSSLPLKSHHCSTPGLFWGCYDKRRPNKTGPITSPGPQRSPSSTSTKPAASSTCTREAFFGLICLDPSRSDHTKEQSVPASTITPPPEAEGDGWRDEM